MPQGCVLNPPPGKPVSRRHPPPRRRRRRGHRRRHAARAARQGRAADLQDRHPDDHRRRRPAHRRSRSPTTRPRCTPAGATRRRAWTPGAAQNAAFGNLWKATAEINESLFPHVQWSRDYRTDSGGAGPVAGPLRQPLREGGAGRRQGLHVRRRHEVPDAGHRRRRAGRAEPADHPRRLRRPVRRRSTPPTGCRSRPASASCTTTAAAAAGATRSTATRRPCSTTCSTSTCRVEGAERDYGVVLTGSLEDLTLAVDEDATERAPRRRADGRA